MPNPGSGGWAAILCHGKRRKYISGGVKDTTNIRMEVLAAVKGIEALLKRCNVTLYSDSEHVVKCIEGVWRFRQNQDLIARLQTGAAKHQVKAIWVRGHTGMTENEKCDKQAKCEAKKIKDNL